MNELRELGSPLASIPPVPAFEAPPGYFERFPANMLELVASQQELPAHLKEAKSHAYTVPEEYFNAFPARMLELATATHEPSEALKQANTIPYKVPEKYFDAFPTRMLDLAIGLEYSAILNQAGNNPYTVPAGYFEELAHRMLAMANVADAAPREEIAFLSPLLSSLDKKMPYSAPEGYFNELTDAVAGQPEEKLSSMMSYLRDEQVYEAPAGYFEELPAMMIEKIGNRQRARIVSFSTSKILRYAAAALIAGVIATGGWFYAYKGSPYKLGAVADASAPVIPGNVSEDALKLYLEGNIAAPEVSLTPAAEIKETDMKEMLADISDEELLKYADKNSLKSELIN